jgi:hypothetical protein
VPTNRTIGLDVGLTHFYTDSNSQTVDNPRHLRKSEKALKRFNLSTNGLFNFCADSSGALSKFRYVARRSPGSQKVLQFSGLVARIAKLSSKINPTTRQRFPIPAYDHCLYSTLAAEQRHINDVVHGIKG